MTTNTRDVPDHLVPAVLALVAKVNKRAAKLGVPPFTVTQGAAVVRNTAVDGFGQPLGEPRLISFVPITVSGEPVKAPGHTFLGRVDFEDGATVISARPGVEIPTKYRKANHFCDHCQAERRRNSVFVFERDAGGHIQVGRSCLRDFMGHDPEATLFAARAYGSLLADIDEEVERGMGAAKPLVHAMDVLACSAYAIRLHGFTSKRQVEEDPTRVSTSSIVFDLLFDEKTRRKQKPEIADVERAAAVAAWVNEDLAKKQDATDYEHNAVELLAAVHVSPRRIGLLTSLVATHNRVLEERVARAAEVDAYVGEVGQRRDFDAVYRGEHWFDTSFGSMCVARFQTAEGLLVYKGASPFWPDSTAVGQAMRFKGTVKEHVEYKGRKQTVVARCKLAVAA